MSPNGKFKIKVDYDVRSYTTSYTVSEYVNSKWEVRYSGHLTTPTQISSSTIDQQISDDGNYFLLRKYTNAADDISIAVYLTDGTLLTTYTWQQVSDYAGAENGNVRQVLFVQNGIKVNETVLPFFSVEILETVLKYVEDRSSESDVKASIEQMGSDDPDVRESAMERLRYAAARFEKELSAAAESSPSAEIRMRAKAILDQTASHRKIVQIFRSNRELLIEIAKNWKDSASREKVTKVTNKIGSALLAQ